MRLQIQKRKAEEQERQRRAIDKINENRHRLEIQSELIRRGNNIDQQHRHDLQSMVMYRTSDIENDLLNLHAVNEMVESPEDQIMQ